MTRLVTLCPFVVVVCVAGMTSPAAAQVRTVLPEQVLNLASARAGDLHGLVLDEKGTPLPGAVVSAVGSTSVFAVTDGEGRFAFRGLTPGPYLVRAHLQGYIPNRARMIQVSGAARNTSTIALTRRGSSAESAQVLAAGIGAPEAPAVVESKESGEHDHGEVAWRLRHLRRSVLKEAQPGVLADAAAEDDESLFIGSLETVGRAVGSSARLASTFLTDLPVSAQINLLTSTSIHRPQELFAARSGAPRGVAFISLGVPTDNGEWAIDGAVTDGDLASWVVAGSYVRRAPTPHQYEAGLSYGMQRYLGGNAAALASFTDGSRNVGSVHAYDRWTLTPRIEVSYGAKYGLYDYLDDRGLFSPRAAVTVAPFDGDDLRMRAGISRREIAPGAEEFLPPASGVWLPPERTFSPVSPRSTLRPERVNHVEVSAERPVGQGVIVGVRAFRQDVKDQVVTMFGVSLPQTAAADVGHYYVASAGDLAASGWGVSVSRTMSGHVRGSIDYTQVDAEWTDRSRDYGVLAIVAPGAVRGAGERLHDVTTTLNAQVPTTATRFYLVYKINTAFADDRAPGARAGTRFDVQVNQSLPFLDFASAQWEMLLAVRSLFRDELMDGSVYDELLVVRPPKRVVGGLTVRF